MITVAYAQEMARYSAWQNASHIAAANTLSDAERRRDRGAHFGSIQATLNHLLWGDRIWLHRFAGTEPPAPKSIADSAAYLDDWCRFTEERRSTDTAIIAWADVLPPDWLVGSLSWYSGTVGRDVSKPRPLLVMHFFNHQTHHRGQVHAMLTAAGARPDDTDLFLRPEN